jgi:arginyl-tRNA synthetase
VTPESTVTFNPKESLAFTGKTGPYVQYMHARIRSMQRKCPDAPAEFDVEFAKLLAHPTERKLLIAIAQFPDVVAASADALDPSTLVQYLYDFAKIFADFYHDVPVLKADADVRSARLALADATRIVLARGLTLLGITPLEEM